MKLMVVIRKKIALHTAKREGTVAKRGDGN